MDVTKTLRVECRNCNEPIRMTDLGKTGQSIFSAKFSCLCRCEQSDVEQELVFLNGFDHSCEIRKIFDRDFLLTFEGWVSL